MNRSDIVKEVAKALNEKKEVIDGVIDTMIKAIHKGIKRDKKVVLLRLGTIYVKTWNKTKVRMPNTGEIVELPPKKVIRFFTSIELSKAIARRRGA